MQSPDFENNLNGLRQPDYESDEDDNREPEHEEADIESIYYRLKKEVDQELYGDNRALVHKIKESKLETNS
jgi:hypothetical protein